MGAIVNYTRVSIHAPVKGATATVLPSADISTVSIHAPVKGATDAYLIM